MALLGRLGRRLLPLAFVLSAFASVVAPRPAIAEPASEAPSAYIVVDAGTGKVMAAKNSHEPHLTASTAKLLTTLTAIQKVPLSSTVTVSARAAAQPASKISMLEGQVWPFNDVLRAVLMESANDAAYATAERTSGSVEQFAKDAQAEAQRLGAVDTTFGDPAGLDDAASYAGGTRMSAYDLAVVARNVLATPELADITKAITYELTDPAGTAREFRNHNDGFLQGYAGAIGMKTGYTKQAGRTLVTAATRNGRTMIGVVFGTWDDSGWSKYLLDVGFGTSDSNGETLPPVRAVTADSRLAAYTGMPKAFGVPALTAAATTATTTPPPTASSTTTTSTTKPKDSGGASGDSGSGGAAATTAAASSEDSGSGGFSLGTIFNLRNFVIVVFVILLTLFLLRRRAVRRQRARRIARQKRMHEIRRRRMIDVVDPAAVEADEVSHVKVVPTGAAAGN